MPRGNTLKKAFALGMCWTMSVSSVALAQAYAPLVSGTNQIMKIYGDGALEPEGQRAIARIACERLGDLLKNSNFTSDLRNAVGKASPQDRARGRQLISNLADFVDTFRTAERETMIKAGFDPNVADQALLVMASAREKGLNGDFGPDAILRMVVDLQNAACNLQNQIGRDIDAATSRRRIVLVVVGILGVVAVASDVSALPVTSGVSVASVNIGAGVINSVLVEGAFNSRNGR